jgi:Icc-related predicted phosphoesterase
MTPRARSQAGSRLEGAAPASEIRIGAVGDIHFNGEDTTILNEVVRAAERDADVLLLCGDLTTHGTEAQAEGVARALGGLAIPVVTVLGNHDYEGGEVDAVKEVLHRHHVRVLDGSSTVVGGIGFAGVKGFAGGFGRGSLGAFGEPIMKAFVQEAVDEALKLENAMRGVGASARVVLLHYAPIPETLVGEPEVIFPFLGSSRLLPPIDSMGADVVFHGHAHTGVLEARTPAGIPVYNVAYPVLVAAGRGPVFIHRLAVPEPGSVTGVAGPGAPVRASVSG